MPPVGTLASIRAFLERRSLAVCLASLAAVLGEFALLLMDGSPPALHMRWLLAYAAIQGLAIYGSCWVILVGACARGYSSSRCQICCVILLLGGLLVLFGASALLGKSGVL
jgi:hypothetical protein